MYLVTDGATNFNRDEPGNARCLETVAHERDPQLAQATGALGNCMGPIDVELCSEIKKDGTEIAIIYTEYLNFSDDKDFQTILKPQIKQIEENLRKCVSRPEFFAKAGFEGDMYKEMFKVYKNVITKLKIVE
uniref:Uncharacterized protein n=1 Tax=Panagrolaimus sp. ES5 TaxID=591445 RepID=A0AC34GV34_9BILA